ncbi:MAG: hypothetical protein ACKOWF_14530 [Chloroflexota bacterium]
MRFDPDLSIGSVLAGLSVLVSAAALAYGWRKDRQFRHREYADLIRTAAGRVAVALERWQLIARQLSDDLPPVLVEAARLAVDGDDRPAAAHLLRTTLLSRRAAIALRIADERLEAAYVDLYGYDPRIHALFTGAVQRMQAIDRQAFAAIEDRLMRDLGNFTDRSAEALATALRMHCDDLTAAYVSATGRVIEGFRAEMLKLIEADDDRIIARKVDFQTADQAMPAVPDALPAPLAAA